MKRILSFGGGLQTTALAILVAQGKLQVDEVVFADTGCEKPETYWYMENYIKPLFEEVRIPFTIVKSEVKKEVGGLYQYYWQRRDIPSIIRRECTDHFKIRPMNKYNGKDDICLIIGFSLDEAHRAEHNRHKNPEFPLIEKQLDAKACRCLISDYGLPVPLKSSCYICQFQPVIEWNWLKNNHPELFQKALDLENRYHERKPEMRDNSGLLRGTPLWRMREGLQPEMFQSGEYSCWSGHCGH